MSGIRDRMAELIHQLRKIQHEGTTMIPARLFAVLSRKSINAAVRETADRFGDDMLTLSAECMNKGLGDQHGIKELQG